MADRLFVAAEVQDALAAGRAVVALESTLISHGLPRPQNLEVAHLLEATVRARGAVPATIGVIAGRLTVGLARDEIELLASASNVRKCSRRDLPIVVADGGHAATTVAGTVAIMGLVGLSVLATGGIGGVHRGAELTFDISADLAELARTRVLVVSAGAKALLDLPRTFELLETLGVLVLGWRSEHVPAFYTARSGLDVLASVADAIEAALIAQTAWDLDLARGVLLTVPPSAATALSAEEADRALTTALEEAERGGLRGAAVTPFLLSAVATATEGRSVTANIALLEQNADVAADVAAALSAARPLS